MAPSQTNAASQSSATGPKPWETGRAVVVDLKRGAATVEVGLWGVPQALKLEWLARAEVRAKAAGDREVLAAIAAWRLKRQLEPEPVRSLNPSSPS